MYASCVDYEVRRREVEEGDICGGWGIGDVDCILLYMIYFGDELGYGSNGSIGIGELGWMCWIRWVVGGSEVRKPSLVHLKHSRTDRIS